MELSLSSDWKFDGVFLYLEKDPDLVENRSRSLFFVFFFFPFLYFSSLQVLYLGEHILRIVPDFTIHDAERTQ